MITGFISFVFGVLVYFLPTVISYIRKNPSTKLILVNVLVGWTGIGWLGCLVWSVMRNKS